MDLQVATVLTHFYGIVYNRGVRRTVKQFDKYEVVQLLYTLQTYFL